MDLWYCMSRAVIGEHTTTACAILHGETGPVTPLQNLKKQSFWKFSFKLLENPSYSHATTFFAFEARVVPCEQASNLLSEFKIDIDMSALAFPCVLRALLLTQF